MAELTKCKECGTTIGLTPSYYNKAYAAEMSPEQMERFKEQAAELGVEVWEIDEARAADDRAHALATAKDKARHEDTP